MAARRSLNLGNNAIYPRVEFHDLIFPARCSGAEYHLRWSANMTTKDFYSVVMCKESAILFCAREGWISAVAPVCVKVGCRERKIRTSYIAEIKPGVWCWRYRCCRCTVSILKGSIFYKSQYGPAKVLELRVNCSIGPAPPPT